MENNFLLINTIPQHGIEKEQAAWHEAMHAATGLLLDTDTLEATIFLDPYHDGLWVGKVTIGYYITPPRWYWLAFALVPEMLPITVGWSEGDKATAQKLARPEDAPIAVKWLEENIMWLTASAATIADELLDRHSWNYIKNPPYLATEAVK